MATLYVRDVPDDLYERLREEAQRSRRSIGATAIELLRAELPERRRRGLTISEWLERAREMRERHPAVTDSAADLIREDRDR